MPRSPVTISDLLRDGLLKPGQELRYHGRDDIKARVTSRGTLTFAGVEYTSPSAAATAAQGTSENGWTAWRIRTRGAELSLGDLRAQVLSS